MTLLSRRACEGATAITHAFAKSWGGNRQHRWKKVSPSPIAGLKQSFRITGACSRRASPSFGRAHATESSERPCQCAWGRCERNKHGTPAKGLGVCFKQRTEGVCVRDRRAWGNGSSAG